MGQFTIMLPGNLKGNVRWGIVRKESFSLNLFKGSTSGSEIKKGYIVKVEPSFPGQIEYRLLKTKEGDWIPEDDGGFQVTPDDKISLEIKNAIDNYESQH